MQRKSRYSERWPGPIPEEDRTPLAPVTIRQTRECRFKAKSCDLCDLPKSNKAHSEPGGCPGKYPRGCANCGRPKNWTGHVGAPTSFNAFGSGANQHAWQGQKKQWADILRGLLEESRLRKGVERVFVEGVVCFGDQTERDQGNFRIMIEKSLGDLLVEDGWLHGDDWSRYQFGNLALRYVPGENWTELTLTPAWERFPVEEDSAPAQGTLL